jgi:hypothetical protein
MLPLYVAEDLYEDVNEFIAARRKALQTESDSGPGVPPTPATTAGPTSAGEDGGKEDDNAEAGWDAERLRALLNHPRTNQRLVRALVAVARSDGHQLRADDIARAAGLMPGRSWGGFISRAQTSCKRRFGGRGLPIRGAGWDGIRNTYRLEPEDAVVIREWADEHGR